ncbi:PREDICTED: protein farnesyltransferase subunit beta [Populus euphratica]|uniref:Protein farnesyltransferase subunit beta n=1 Tax=Populus euphratica TaxID=75702 RepID=A0AAJ6TKC4_POPEU|nr:PREDICTED: protein farnesyltransferase subunit beta [Populus euphratica]
MESGRETVTQVEQWSVEDRVFRIYNMFASIPPGAQTTLLELQRDEHIKYLNEGLKQLGPSFVALDSSRPWLCYWIIHSMALLGESLDYELENNAIDFLNRCQDPNGGFGGGPGQMPHLATTYAAVNSIVTLGGQKALSSINRDKLYNFLLRMKDPSGAFRMHDAGEIDVRACYTAISVASILNILDDELVRGVGNFILSCQTYEGGIAGEPGSEAHGGYTFCGLAAMILINEVNHLDLAGLIDWVVFRQGVECGFQGRVNKLVDGCYSFWQGGVLALLQRIDLVTGEYLSLFDSGEEDSPGNSTSEGEDTDGISSGAEETCHFKNGEQQDASCSVNYTSSNHTRSLGNVETEPLFHSLALQQYILLCSQLENGGFRDKPGKPRDFYHTCYCLSGLSVCQHCCSKDYDSPSVPGQVLGPYPNLLEPVHPLYNVVLKQYREVREFFSRSRAKLN